VLHPHLALDTDYVARFKREVQISRALISPHIVRVRDWGQDGEAYYLVMDLVEGTTLADVLATRGRLDPMEATSIALQMALALDEARRHKVVHRDVSPQNVLIDFEGHARMTDFGIARDMSTNFTSTTMFLGKPQYASPDQWSGKVDIRSDIYSLGVVFYQMLTGATPFNAPTAIEVLRMHEERPPPPLTALTPGIPPDVEQVVSRCLAKRPGQRYQTPAALVDDLQAILTGGLISDDHGQVALPSQDSYSRGTSPRRQQAGLIFLGVWLAAGLVVAVVTLTLVPK
jgi:serine/threonine-protein kinase